MSKKMTMSACGLMVAVLLVWRMVHPSGEIGTDLLFGWIAFLARVVPQMEVRWDGLAILGVGLIALIALGMGFCVGCIARARSKRMPVCRRVSGVCVGPSRSSASSC